MHQVPTSTVFFVDVNMGRFSRSYIKDGEAAAREWLRTEGRQNIEELNAVLAKKWQHLGQNACKKQIVIAS